MSERRKLPIGVQSFEEIRKGGYYNVDKTRFVKKLVDTGKYFFLSCPRRFGKSLFLDTLRCAFEGRRDLFEGLYLERNWDWTQKFPVIRFDFSEQKVRSADELEKFILNRIRENAQKFGVDITYDAYYEAFMELLRKVSEKHGKVVLLIDEYDKPILDNIENTSLAKEIREILKGFYQVIKPADTYLKFVFMTGVSKFSKVSLFSGLNNLNDITIDKEFNEICGYTQDEFERTFADRIGEVVREMGENVIELIKFWYNGYSWGGKERLYNPFDILLFLQKKEFRPFWFETGTPEFLVKLLLERKYYIPQIEDLSVGEEILESFDVEDIEPETLFFQTGYLTIKERTFDMFGGIEYKLSYPNEEVRRALTNSILTALVRSRTEKMKNQRSLREIVERNDFEGMRQLFERFFSSIPYDWYRRNQMSGYEGYYASIFYTYFTSSGFDVRVENQAIHCFYAEDTTSHGKIDMTVLYKDRAYIFEFKVVKGRRKRSQRSKTSALHQIKEKRYWEKYTANEIYLVGVEFEPSRRNIVRFEWEKLV